MSTLIQDPAQATEPVPERGTTTSVGEKTFLGVSHGILILWSVIVIGPMLPVREGARPDRAADADR